MKQRATVSLLVTGLAILAVLFVPALRTEADWMGFMRQLGVMPGPGSRGERVGVMLQRASARFARRA